MSTTRDATTDTARRTETRPAGPADTVRQVVVLVTSVLAIVAAFIGSGAFVGTPIQQAAGGWLDADSTLIAPGRPAFSIWSVIYTGMLAYAIWQLLPAQRTDARHRRIGYAVVASLVLNALWIGVVQLDLLGMSLPVIVVLLAVLAWLFVQLRRMPPKNLVDTIVTDGSIGLYLGWVVVATAANATAVLAAADFSGWGLPHETWAVIVIAAAAAVGVGLAVWGRGRIAPMLSLCWGLSWVAVARLTDQPESTTTGIAAVVAVVVVVLATLGARFLAMRAGPAGDAGRTDSSVAEGATT
ncbi:tryptophan-rich sensory protein [Agromyces indicus]|uniref:Tryptophan-rich sensory protein n=1 Tax=Agromyces indicus TaxID=758919 RepID=A0ABU1FNC4_9MICO|nr:tryptophan-rich sensory protein [Agromyces indicus]MDR5692812.1 tryptophan-rich sensory protein [Agromyces indicus]